MSRTTAAFLALLITAIIAITTPLAAIMWGMVLERIVSVGQFWFSTLLACVAAPILYLMFRKMM